MTIDAMKNIDIRTVSLDDLADLRDVHVDESLPRVERIRSFLEQIRNPYCYKVGKMIVKIGFTDTEVNIEDRLEHYIRGL